ncbi:unnamed protein product [Dibothriocephalus latus]|uniref:Uncharacterized protein n=1 Tax=Dibothriocephalus latus TaxID=60516 RepID=A0A3P7P1M1_DIBLA|nr:unnamed protein product [Dibothriocephalus latus]
MLCHRVIKPVGIPKEEHNKKDVTLETTKMTVCCVQNLELLVSRYRAECRHLEDSTGLVRELAVSSQSVCNSLSDRCQWVIGDRQAQSLGPVICFGEPKRNLNEL